MTKPLSIAVLVGSLRKNSLSRKLAYSLKNVAPTEAAFTILEIGDLALYNEDLEPAVPLGSWQRFRESISRADGVLFVTPEYNRSIPAVLKNALDVGSRPFGESVWEGLPGAVVSISQGGIGGFGANHHLRQSLVSLNVPTMQQPEAYVGNAGDLFNADGELTNSETRTFLKRFVKAFTVWTGRNHRNLNSPSLTNAAHENQSNHLCARRELYSEGAI
jgi:chromate reductase